MTSSTYNGTVIHKRFKPKTHFFKYSVFSLLIDLSELNYLDKTIKIFSHNKFNLISFYEKDHGDRDGSSLIEWVKKNLNENDINSKDIRIKLLCYPRIFGYVFNPLSIIYCYDESELLSIFYEVKNTSNEQHTYIFSRGQTNNLITLKHECEKNFYVSPFIGMKGKYCFTNKLTNDYLNIIIDLYDSDNKKILMAAQSGTFTAFKASKLLKYNLFNPLLGFKVMSAILFEAIRIIFKGGKYYAREKKPKDTISFEGSF